MVPIKTGFLSSLDHQPDMW